MFVDVVLTIVDAITVLPLNGMFRTAFFIPVALVLDVAKEGTTRHGSVLAKAPAGAGYENKTAALLSSLRFCPGVG